MSEEQVKRLSIYNEEQRYDEVNKELYKLFKYEQEIMKCNIFKKNMPINGYTYIMLHNKLNEVIEKYIHTSNFCNYNIFDFKQTINNELIQNPNLTDYTKISSLIQYIHLYCEDDNESTELEKSKRYDDIFNIINKFNDYYYYYKTTYDNRALRNFLSKLNLYTLHSEIKRLILFQSNIDNFTWTKLTIIRQIMPEYWMYINNSLNDLYINELINYPYLKTVAKLEYKIIHSQEITDEDKIGLHFENKNKDYLNNLFNEWYNNFINSWRYNNIIKYLNENEELLLLLKPLTDLEPYQFNSKYQN